MATLKEYVCLAHGDFDALTENLPDDAPGGATSVIPPCPHGCGPSMVQRVFRTPPAFQSSAYRGTNSTIETLMQEQGITDINQRGGDGMRMTDWRASKRASEAMAMYGHGANSQTDMNQFFAPVSAMGKYAAGAPPSLVKQDGVTMVAGSGVALGKPGVIHAAPAFDGSALGLPAGDT